jgi:hypothetical protein
MGTWGVRICCVLAVGALGVAACADDEPDATPTTSASVSPTTVSTGSSTSAPGGVADPALREELLAMLAEDQRVRESIDVPADADDVDAHNQSRLAAIFDEHGWPGWSLVGEDGSTAAWAIAQHADLDLAFQQRALELLQAAVDAGDASKGDLAYLTDRVLVAKGEPQLYGTQWGAAADGTPEPRTPIADEANVDARRADAGLSTLAEYLEELEAAFGG